MKRFQGLILVFLAISASGCAMKWSPDWQEEAVSKPSSRSAALLAEARLAFGQAVDEPSLRASIRAFEKVIAENPGEYQALKQLSTQYILLGTAYTEKRRRKSAYFRRAMTYAERAMYTNARFRALADNGKKPWEAVHTLTSAELEAMFFWVTALQYEFKEGMTLPQKIINVQWLERALIFLDRIEEVDPDFGGGAVQFAKVICYYVLPQSKGGSKSKGDAYMAEAVQRGDDWLLPRWARGKYYYPIQGNKDMAKEELKWVASRDPGQFKDPYPWRVHFQDDARRMLE